MSTKPAMHHKPRMLQDFMPIIASIFVMTLLFAAGTLCTQTLSITSAYAADSQSSASNDTATTIYINGSNGNDSNDGLTAANAVKTFAKAKELATANQNIKTIYVTGQVNASGDVSLSGTNAILKRANGYTGYVLNVSGTTTLSDITIDGNKENVSSDKIATCPL